MDLYNVDPVPLGPIGEWDLVMKPRNVLVLDSPCLTSSILLPLPT